MMYLRIITLVLYFGKKRWNKNTMLSENMDIPEELRPYVNDYKMNLVEVAWQTDEQLAMYKSDFKIVADYFVQKRKGNYIPSKETIKHVDSVLKLMSAISGDDRFEQVVNERLKGERKVKNMCELLDRVENRGVLRGRKEGLKEGRKEGIKEGKKEGIKEGGNEINAMYDYLHDNGRDEDMLKALKDETFRNDLLEKFRAMRENTILT